MVNIGCWSISRDVSMAFLEPAADGLQMPRLGRIRSAGDRVQDLKPGRRTVRDGLRQRGVHRAKPLTLCMLHHRCTAVVGRIVPVHGSGCRVFPKGMQVFRPRNEGISSHILGGRGRWSRMAASAGLAGPRALARICGEGATPLFVRIRNDIVAAARPGPAET